MKVWFSHTLWLKHNGGKVSHRLFRCWSSITPQLLTPSITFSTRTEAIFWHHCSATLHLGEKSTSFLCHNCQKEVIYSVSLCMVWNRFYMCVIWSKACRHLRQVSYTVRYQMMKVQSWPHSPGSGRVREGDTSTPEATTHLSTDVMGGWGGVTAHQGAGQHHTEQTGKGRKRNAWSMRETGKDKGGKKHESGQERKGERNKCSNRWEQR